MYKLKVAVNKRGRLIVLEEFPDDERHAGLNEMISDLEDGEYDIEAGIYSAEVIVETHQLYHAPSPDDCSYLNIIKLSKNSISNYMLKTKKQILNLHKKAKKSKITAEIFEKENGRLIPSFNVVHTQDDRGWYTKTTLFASNKEESCWTTSYKGTKVVEISDFDGNVEITSNGSKIEMSYAELCDLITAFMANDYFYKIKLGRSGMAQLKIGNVRKKKSK